MPDSALFHLFLLSDEARVQGLLFAAFALVALALLVGYRTRLVTPLALLLTVSLQRRNPFVCHTGDAYLTALLVWCSFLPLGESFSVDRRWRGRGDGRRSRLSLATAALLLQIGVFYFAAGALKHQNPEWVRGDALSIFCGIEEYTRPFGAFLGSLALPARLLTWGTLVLEGLGSVLLFSPWATARVRAVLLALFAAFHVGIQLSVHIGIFEVLSLVALVAFLPGAAWDRLAARAGRGRVGRALAAWDRPLVPAPRPASGALRVARAGLRLVARAALALALVVCLLGNAARIAGRPWHLPWRGLYVYARQLDLLQNWNVFSRVEGTPRGWFLVLGQRADGSLVDVLARSGFTGLSAPRSFASTYVNHNERRLWWNALQRRDPVLPAYLADHLRRTHERETGEPLLRLAIFHVGRDPLSDQPARARLVELHEASVFRALCERLGRGTPAFHAALVHPGAAQELFRGPPPAHLAAWESAVSRVLAETPRPSS